MAVSKSILEDMELSTGTSVTVQGSRKDSIVISIDSSESNHSFYMTSLEAIKFATLLQLVVQEQAE